MHNETDRTVHNTAQRLEYLYSSRTCTLTADFSTTKTKARFILDPSSKQLDFNSSIILLINYEEKWFDGCSSHQCKAKMVCEVRGFNKTHTYLYHTLYTNKVMAVTLTVFVFNLSNEKSGRGVKIGLYRVQAS